MKKIKIPYFEQVNISELKEGVVYKTKYKPCSPVKIMISEGNIILSYERKVKAKVEITEKKVPVRFSDFKIELCNNMR